MKVVMSHPLQTKEFHELDYGEALLFYFLFRAELAKGKGKASYRHCRRAAAWRMKHG